MLTLRVLQLKHLIKKQYISQYLCHLFIQKMSQLGLHTNASWFKLASCCAVFVGVSQVTLGPMSTWVWSLCTRSFWENTTDWLRSFTNSILTGARTRCTRKPGKYWGPSTRWEDVRKMSVKKKKGYLIYSCIWLAESCFGRSWHGITTCHVSWAAVLTWSSCPHTKVTTLMLTPASPTFSPPLPFGLHMWPSTRLWTALDPITGWALNTRLCRYTTLCLHPGGWCKRVRFTNTLN